MLEAGDSSQRKANNPRADKTNSGNSFFVYNWQDMPNIAPKGKFHGNETYSQNLHN